MLYVASMPMGVLMPEMAICGFTYEKKVIFL